MTRRPPDEAGHDRSAELASNTAADAIRRWRARGCVLVTLVVTVMTVAGAHTSVRAVLALAFLLFVPGNAIVSEVGLDDPLAEATLAGAVSVAIATAAAMVMLWCRLWNPAAAEVVLAAVSLPFLVRQAGWWPRVPPPDDEAVAR